MQSGLARLKLTTEEINAGLALIKEVETAREIYVEKKGDAQIKTKIKEESFIKINDWMSDFYAVAKIAFSDQPQMMESLGIR